MSIRRGIIDLGFAGGGRHPAPVAEYDVEGIVREGGYRDFAAGGGEGQDVFAPEQHFELLAFLAGSGRHHGAHRLPSAVLRNPGPAGPLCPRWQA